MATREQRLPGWLQAEIRAFWPRVYRTVGDEALVAIKSTFGDAWKGGRFQWPYLLPGHGYELTQHGTYQFTLAEIPANADASSVHTLSYPVAYASGQVPDVQATSTDPAWVALGRPTPGTEETQADLFVVRAVPLALRRKSGAQNANLTAGSSASGTVTVTYSAPAWASTPSLALRADGPDYVPIVTAESTTGFSFILYYRPAQGHSVTTADATGVVATSTTDPVPGAGETGAIEAGISTGTQDHDHHHSVPAGTDAGGGTTGIQDTNHGHGMSPPGSTHKHPVGSHGHPVADHHHAVSVTQPVVPSNTTRTVTWTALGPESAPAATVLVAWQATALQPVP